MADETGLKIKGRVYPIPSNSTLGEARRIKLITKLNVMAFWNAVQDAWGERPEGQDMEIDPDVFTALVWLAMHREDATTTVESVDDLDFTDIEFVGPAPASSEETTAPDPPTESAGVAATEPQSLSAPAVQEKQVEEHTSVSV